MSIRLWGAVLPALSCALLLPACTPSPAEKPAETERGSAPSPHALSAAGPSAAEPAEDSPAPPPLPKVTPAEVALEEPLPPLKTQPDAFLPPPVTTTLPQDLPPGEGAADPKPFPPAVTAFMIDRDGCDHFRGEEAYDADRAAFLEENLRQLCTGTDARLAALRGRYAGNPDVIAALAHYEDRIEGGAE
ncbi:MAG: hypothetical protein ACO1NM_05120 [Sphingobium phenoxybenzoativorans]|uniref:hypothetical protein n=1 Tax=Sphingobium phenoxybenzoativorans TaxID=1592790 RepID=UPI000B2F81B6|nr:hypothetical protein [Sphingobium phenoxybenzoativorans]